jgi:hypothetical protein
MTRFKQAQTFNFWTSTFEKISKILKNFDFFGLFSALFSTFETEARPSALKILKSRRTKVVLNKGLQLFKLQLFLFLHISIGDIWSYPTVVVLSIVWIVYSQKLRRNIENVHLLPTLSYFAEL